MPNYAKFVAFASCLLLSLTAQASAYTSLSGGTFDLYYDADILGNNVSLVNNQLTIALTEGAPGFYLNAYEGSYDQTALVVVPHAGYALQHVIPIAATGSTYFGGLGSGDTSTSATSHVYGGAFSGGAFTFHDADTVASYSGWGTEVWFNGDPLDTSSQSHSLFEHDSFAFDPRPDDHFAAYAVNFSAGGGTVWNGDSLAVHSPAVQLYFATMVAPPVLPVPEPQTWLMLLGGLALLARRIKSSRCASTLSRNF